MKDIALAANTIRGLAMDGVQAANSGHPGMPMGAADYAACLFLKHLDYCPSQPSWPNRDRFVLSAGHGSMLIYSLLHLAGYDLPMDELKAFRQWNSLTPGHPEVGKTPGVETTTGPLGQGCANAVGMALAERMLADRFNTDDIPLVDHNTFLICSDGDLMEGLSHEAFSLAGHLGLSKLIALYDYNNITIEGSTDLAYSEDVRKRFEAYNWNVLEVDGHNLEEIDQALVDAKAQSEKPTIIIAHTHIAQGSPNVADTSGAHGSPLGADEIKATKKNLGLPEDQDFYVPEEVRASFGAKADVGKESVAAWELLLAAYQASYPDKADLWAQCQSNVMPDNLADCLPAFSDAIATRAASGKVLQKLAEALPFLVGGSADLAPSTKTLLTDHASIGPNQFGGRNLHFGIREHAMGSMLNGMALHGGFSVYGATFFVFADYCRPAVRLAAIMKLPVIYVFTHDSFYVGEDGPTHQPVEQLASLRCIPNVTVIRPADATETGAAWVAALKNQTGPTALLLTRQNLPVIDRAAGPPADSLEKGAYTLWQSADGDPDVLLIGSGSEAALALVAAKALAGECCVRVVSMPSWELFEQQDAAYQAEVIPAGCPTKIAIEAGSSMGWHKYIGREGRVIGMDHFGASGPYEELEKQFGFTADNVVSVVQEMRANA